MSRRTEQKAAIRAAITGAGRPLTAQEICDAAQEDVPGLGLATVYRNVKTLVEQEWLHPVELPGEPTRYEPASMERHHHFQCDDCNKVFDVHGPTGNVGGLVPQGFELRTHEIIMYGRCDACT